MSDPTQRLLHDLEDPKKFYRVENVPIFEPHTKMKTMVMPDGRDKKVKVEVTLQDLGDIAQRMNALARKKGQLIRITPGHTLPQQDVPEDKQPPPWGYAKDLKVGKWGPEQNIGLLATFYYMVDKASEALKSYPNRSAEYYDKSKEITGVALLRRDAELDLGMIAYGRDGAHYRYTMEGDMPDFEDDDLPGKKPDPTKPPDALEDLNNDGKVDDKDKSIQDKLDEYMKAMCSHKYFKDLSAHYGMDGGAPAAGPGMPGPTNATVPGAPKKKVPTPSDLDGDGIDDDLEGSASRRMQRDNLAIQYARLERREKEKDQRIAALEYSRTKEQCERVVTQLEAEGFLIRDRAKEVERLALMPSNTERNARTDEIRANYQKDPAAGGFLRVHEGPTEKSPVTREQSERAVRYASEKGYKGAEGFNKALAELQAQGA